MTFIDGARVTKRRNGAANLQNRRIASTRRAIRKSPTSLLNACCVVSQHNWKDTISVVHVSPCSAETLVRTAGITNHHLIGYYLSNQHLCQNYQNRLMYVEVIVCNISIIFETVWLLWHYFCVYSVWSYLEGDGSCQKAGTWPVCVKSLDIKDGLRETAVETQISY